MDEARLPAPPQLHPLLDDLFQKVEHETGWPLTSPRAATVEIVRDGRLYTMYLKGKYPVPPHGQQPE